MLRIELLVEYAAWVKVEGLPFGGGGLSAGFALVAPSKPLAREALLEVAAQAMCKIALERGADIAALCELVNAERLRELANLLHQMYWVLLDFGVCREEVVEAKLARGILRPTLAEITMVDAWPD